MTNSNLDKTRVQELYSEVIGILFNGAVVAEPEQITEQVIQDVDLMLNEIAVCSRLVTDVSFDVLYSILLSPVVGAVVDKVLDPYQVNFLQKLVIKLSVNTSIKLVLKQWIEFLSKNYRFIGCVNKARANWRSKIEIELMGL